MIPDEDDADTMSCLAQSKFHDMNVLDDLVQLHQSLMLRFLVSSRKSIYTNPSPTRD